MKTATVEKRKKQINRISISQAIVVEGRDDVDAVSRAADALIIPTHGFGITAETWAVISKAYEEKGLIILTDPDHSGEEIRSRLTSKYPDAVQAYIAKADALCAGDIGVENACPEVIIEALERALANNDHRMCCKEEKDSCEALSMSDLTELGLTGCEGASELREEVCSRLGIGHGNARALIRKLQYWKIGKDKLEQTIEEIKQNKQTG